MCNFWSFHVHRSGKRIVCGNSESHSAGRDNLGLVEADWRECEWPRDDDGDSLVVRGFGDDDPKWLKCCILELCSESRNTAMQLAFSQPEVTVATDTIDASSCTGLTTLIAPMAKSVYTSDCTNLTRLIVSTAESVYASGCTSLTTLIAPKAEYIDARNCTSLVELIAPLAKTVDASGCTNLTKLIAPKAEYIDVSSCTSLTTLNAPKAEYIDTRECTSLIKAPSTCRVIR